MKKDDAGQAVGWSIQGGLHTSCAEDFVTRRAGDIPSVFSDSLLPFLLKDMDAMCLEAPADPPRPCLRLQAEDLVEEFRKLNVEGTRTLFGAVVELAKGHLDIVEMERLVAERA